MELPKNLKQDIAERIPQENTEGYAKKNVNGIA